MPDPSLQSVTDAHIEGRRACAAGEPIGANPHARGSAWMRDAWHHGWETEQMVRHPEQMKVRGRQRRSRGLPRVQSRGVTESTEVKA